MSTTSISRRYARALFELQVEGVAISAALNSAADVVAVPEVAAVLDQPKYPAAVKAGIVDKAAGGLSREVSRLVVMLCERGKAGLLPEIRDLFEEFVRQASSEIEAEVVAATALSKATQDKIAAQLSKTTGRSVVIKATQDKSILGGLVVRLGDRQIDNSLRTRLEGLKRAMVS